MKKTLLLLFVFIPLLIHSQHFAPIGATWHYTRYSVVPIHIGYSTITSVGTTVIDGMECLIMEGWGDILFGSGQFYMHTRNDSVFFYKNDAFHLLYDFSAEKGDTVVLEYFTIADHKPLEMIIDSTGTIIISNQPRKVQYVTSDGGLFLSFSGVVIQGIGNTHFMFPTGCPNYQGQLRCYEDDTTSLFKNPFYKGIHWNREECDENILLSGKEELDDRFDGKSNIYPNPAYNEIILSSGSGKMMYFEMMDISGRLRKSGWFTGSTRLDISNLPEGFYFITINDEASHERDIRKVVIQR